MTLVSVVMPSFQQAAYLEKAVESVLSQQGVEVELLVGPRCEHDLDCLAESIGALFRRDVEDRELSQIEAAARAQLGEET